MAGLRPWLRWVLFVSVLSSLLAVWWPEATTREAARADSAPALPTPASLAGATPPLVSVAALPAELARMNLERARFDPFVGVVAAPPSAPKMVPMVASIAPAPPAPLVPEAAPQTRMPPPMNYRFLGQMVNPAGRTLIYLARDDVAVQVGVGSQLEEGYTVEGMDARGVHLHYAPLDARLVIPIPAATPAPTR